MKLRVTIGITALAVTMQTIIQLHYLLPFYEWCGNNYYAVLALVQVFVGILVVCSMFMIGRALFQNRKQLPRLRTFMRTEALIICGISGMLLVWYVISYSLRAANVSDLPNIGSWLKMASYTLLSVWSWQMTCIKSEMFASEEIGTAGKRGAWACVICVIIWLVSIILTIAMCSSEVHVQIYSLIGIVVTSVLHLILLYWLANYCYYSNRSELMTH